MKKEFIGFYNPTENEINQTWSEGVFAFDANTLLNLYRYTEATRKDFLSALNKLKERSFLPYQAAYEFHNNRDAVIEGTIKAYKDIPNLFENNFTSNLEGPLNGFKLHPSISINSIVNLYKDFIKKVQAELEKQKKNHPNFMPNDGVLEELAKLFENTTGKDFSDEELQKIFLEGNSRFKAEIPPGFKDAKKKKEEGEKRERHIYGDLIIWKQLIIYALETKKPIVFITDDRKEDWWRKVGGKTLRPREELIKEFYDLTSIRILIYNSDQFLRFAKERNIVDLQEKTIEEVKEIRASDDYKSVSNYMHSLVSINDNLKRINDAFAVPSLSNIFGGMDEYLLRQSNVTKIQDTFKSLNIDNSPEVLKTLNNFLETLPNRELYSISNKVTSSNFIEEFTKVLAKYQQYGKGLNNETVDDENS